MYRLLAMNIECVAFECAGFWRWMQCNKLAGTPLPRLCIEYRGRDMSHGEHSRSQISSQPQAPSPNLQKSCSISEARYQMVNLVFLCCSCEHTPFLAPSHYGQ